jgi:hypothetical protein
MTSKPSTTIFSEKRKVIVLIPVFQTFRGSVPIQLESSLERDIIVQQETNPSTASIEAQPFEFAYFIRH